jgi:hypothetical protein
LITGALGTTVGLFEVAIDVMSTWRTADNRPVRPLLVASTATAQTAQLADPQTPVGQPGHDQPVPRRVHGVDH